MRLFYKGLFGAILAATPAVAQEEQGIQDAIGGQLEAFVARDTSRAFSYASPFIKRLFDTPENFGMMVEQGYPMVWDNSNVRFLDRDVRGGLIYQKVLMRGPEGATHVVEYEMIETPQGWQINGVRLIPAPDVAA